MKRLKISTRFSSFWLWFVVALVVNQMFVLTLFALVIVKPFADNFGQIVGAAIESTALVIEKDPKNGLADVLTATSLFPGIKISTSQESLQEIPYYFPGMYFLSQSLNELYGEKLDIGYASWPNQGLLIRIANPPKITLHIAFKGAYYGLLFLGLSMLFIILSSIGAAFWISRRLTEPLEQLSDAAMRLGNDKCFLRIEVMQSASPEIIRLAETLNKMRSALDKSATERENLLASVAHDLRTPLSRMRIAIELEGDCKPGFARGLRDDLIEMGAVMEQFIELSRLNLEADEPWRVGSINVLILGLQEKYRRASIELSLSLGDGLPDLKHKPLALTRLLYNLIDNAYRHGSGDVIIHTCHVGSELVLTVSNPVSDECEVTGLLRALQTQGSGRSAGLGLLIVRRFADVHGAQLKEVAANGIRNYVLAFPILTSLE